MEPVKILLQCPDSIVPKARYVFDTLLMAAGVPAEYVDAPPGGGSWILYGTDCRRSVSSARCANVAYVPAAWRFLDSDASLRATSCLDGIPVLFPDRGVGFNGPGDIAFDVIANAFYLLSSWPERMEGEKSGHRALFANSIFARLRLPLNTVDQYQQKLVHCLQHESKSARVQSPARANWPNGARYAVVLSHDVDFLPSGHLENAKQAVKTLARHAIREREPKDALRAGLGYLRAIRDGRDPYGCVPEIVEREQSLGVRSSFQVAVGHRHRLDVNYRIEDDRVRDYLRQIIDKGFEVCLHGSFLSSEHPSWYLEEVELLTDRLAKPLGSRQHFLSFEYDALFKAQEEAGVQYDMSIGFPDHVGSRVGFSSPFFPYCLEEDRPYRVLQIGLVLMDVTLRSYMRLREGDAWAAVRHQLDEIRAIGGCASVVWHPIVFGEARDPGWAALYWRLVQYVLDTSGLATDGRTVNDLWRMRARPYRSFSEVAESRAGCMKR